MQTNGAARPGGRATVKLPALPGRGDMGLPSEREMRGAIAARDTDYDGRFIYGVVTTGVFCRPSCKARPARPENLRFFDGTASAFAAGFRPCKRCKPVEIAPGIDRLVDAARYIEEHADEKLTLASLARRSGLSASRLQRSFRAAFGISPQQFQDAVRMRRLRASLRGGDEVTGAIFEAGYGSTSRVYGEAARSIGMTPATYRRGGAGESIAWACRDTALGTVMMAATGRGICFVQFGRNRRELLEALRAEFPRATIARSAAEAGEGLDAWIEALDVHLRGDAPRPELPLDLRGTAFQVKVWRFLLTVREGEVLSYAELAARIGRPAAVRAAASACARNRIGVLVPCHRVLKSDGSLGGYRWGLERKRALLDAERARRAAQ